MSLVISTQTASTPILEAFKIRFLSPVELSLVTVNPTQLNIYAFSSNNKGPQLLDTLKFNERIISCSHVLPSGLSSEWILALTEFNKFYVISYNDQTHSFVIVQSFHFNDLLAPTVEILEEHDSPKCIISVRPVITVDPNQRFMVIYSNEGFLIVLELRPSKTELFWRAVYQPETLQKKRPILSSDRVFENPYIATIGIRHVHSVTFCNSKLHPDCIYFGLIIRDENLKYRLELYEIEKVKKLEVKMIRKFVPMESNPSQVIPICNNQAGGLLVICERHQYYYGLPNVKLESSLDIKKTNSCVCKMVYSPSEGVLEEFSSWCFIEDYKVLLTSNTGGYFILDFCTRFVNQSEGRRSRRDDTKAVVIIVEWNLKKIRTDRSHNPNWIFKLNSKDFVGITYFSEFFAFNLISSTSTQTLIIGDNKPILNVSTDPLVYCSGDYQGSIIHYKDSQFRIDGCCVKNFKTMEHRSLGLLFIILTESKLINLDMGTIDTTNKLDVFDSTLNRVAGYEFEENVLAFDLICTGDMEFYNNKETFLEPSELANVSQIVSNSFVVVSSSSSDEDDDVNVDDKSEILLFYIDPEGELSLDTMAVINRSVNLIFKWDKKNLLVFGSHTIHWLTLAFYKAAGDVKIKIQLLHNSLNFPVGYPSLVCKAGNQEAVVVADAFNGIYYVRLNTIKQRVRSTKLVQDKILSSALGFFGNDGLIVGDLLGNIYLYKVQVEDTTVQQVLIRQFNLVRGAITCIKGVETGSAIRQVISSKRLTRDKIAVIGTGEGSIVNLYLTNERDSVIDILEQSFTRTVLPNGPLDELILDKLEARSSVRVLPCYRTRNGDPEEEDSLELLQIDISHTRDIVGSCSEDMLLELSNLEAGFP